MTALTFALLGVSVIIYRLIPFGDYFPDYLIKAQILAAGQLLPRDSFAPVGYSLLLAGAVKFAGIAGVIWLQSAIYIAAVLVAWWVLFRQGGQAHAEEQTPPWASAMLLLLVVHPYMLLDTHRIDDNALNVLFIVILANLCKEKFVLQSLGCTLLYGATLGLFTTIRPNAAIFAVLPMITLFLNDVGDARRTLRFLPVLWATAAVFYSAVVFAATGTPFFWPATGPYNFFAGNNAYSFIYLIESFNAEYSIRPALDALGVARNVDVHLVGQQLYAQLGWQFVINHVVGFIALCFTKLIVLFAPRISHSENWFDILVQVLLTFPFLVWISFLVITFRAGMRNDVMRRVAFVSLFVLPFVLTNADPHYRVPLDIWFLIDLAFLSQVARAGGLTGLASWHRATSPGSQASQ